MERGKKLVKHRKFNPKIRRRISIILIFGIVFILTTIPLLWHWERLKQAQSSYNIPIVKTELQWWHDHGGLLNNRNIIKDEKLWLDLNVKSKNLEPQLLTYQDDEHRFWLFLLYIQEGEISKAQEELNKLGNLALSQLGNGIISLSKGDGPESQRLLTESGVTWKKLPIQEQTLRHFILAQAALNEGDYSSAQAELQLAQQLEPNNPACLTVEFDIALGEEQWTKASELSHIIETQSWRPLNPLFETQKAVLAIHENNVQDLSNSLDILSKLPQSLDCLDYVKGIKALHNGDLQEGRNLLELALENGLDGGLKNDAQKALEQVIERQKADKYLRSID